MHMGLLGKSQSYAAVYAKVEFFRGAKLSPEFADHPLLNVCAEGVAQHTQGLD